MGGGGGGGCLRGYLDRGRRVRPGGVLRDQEVGVRLVYLGVRRVRGASARLRDLHCLRGD